MPRNFVECPRCGGEMRHITNTRPSEFHEFKTVKRRRECHSCFFRATTVEVSEEIIQALSEDIYVKRIQSDMAAIARKVVEAANG